MPLGCIGRVKCSDVRNVNDELLQGAMIKGPLVKAIVILAAILIVLSFAVVLLPEHIATIGVVAGVVALLAVVLMIVMLFRMREHS